MTVYKCDWPGHSWPIGHYWILGCLLQSTLVGLKSSQSQKLVIVFFGDIHKNHRENNHSSSNSSKCRSFFHNQRCWGRAPDIQEGDDGGVHWTLRPLPQLVRCCLNLVQIQLLLQKLLGKGRLQKQKTGLCGNNSHVGRPPPPPPVWEFFRRNTVFDPKQKIFKIVKYVF